MALISPLNAPPFDVPDMTIATSIESPGCAACGAFVHDTWTTFVPFAVQVTVHPPPTLNEHDALDTG